MFKVVEAPNMSPKRKQGDEDADEALTAMIPKRRRQVTVIEISDLEKEYMLILARLQLLQHDTDSAHVTGTRFVDLYIEIRTMDFCLGAAEK